jgi:glucokinase
MLDGFLDEIEQNKACEVDDIKQATFGVAAPIGDGVAYPTNIPGWELKVEAIENVFGDYGHEPNVTLINDFEALGYGILELASHTFSEKDFEPIFGRFRTGPPRRAEFFGTRSVVCGPGTGLGVALAIEGLSRDGLPYIVSSEAGHMSLAPETPEQYRFLSTAQGFRGKLSYESVLSHAGLQELYNFFLKTDYAKEPNHSISSSEIISLSSHDRAANDAVELFCEILACYCGNIALCMNCDRAVFLWGGVVREMPIDLLKSRFKNFYPDRCNLKQRVSRLPVVMLKNRDTPLVGCLARSLAELQKP